MAPTEIENILQEHPAVNECLVFGRKDDTVQELISAVVTLKTGMQVRISMLVCIQHVLLMRRYINFICITLHFVSHL